MKKALTAANFAVSPEMAWPLFLAAHTLLVDQIESRSAAGGLPGMDYYDALWALERAPDQRLRMSELAAQMIASRSNVTRLIDRMENDGLVIRERLEEDRRGACAVLTAEGKKLRKKMWAVYGPAIEELFDSQLTKAERAALASAMHKLINSTLKAAE